MRTTIPSDEEIGVILDNATDAQYAGFLADVLTAPEPATFTRGYGRRELAEAHEEIDAEPFDGRDPNDPSRR